MRIAVAMSGGVDSSVAAALLAEAGHEVVGLFMKTGVAASGTRSCCSLADAHDAARVADRLGIPFYALDYREEFDRIRADFVEQYARGRTPNPCVRCNQWLKFDALRREATAAGAEGIATGHYARLERAGDRAVLRRGVDRAKDQSYVLFGTDPDSLADARFPVGAMRKEEVRAHARRLGLPVHDKPESQEICFVPDGDVPGYLRGALGDRMRPGEIVDGDGNVLGRHGGAAAFTVGQRRGLGIGGRPRPLYVTEVDVETDRVVVGEGASLARDTMEVDDVRWWDPPGGPLRARVQIRYHHEAAPALVTPDGNVARVRFDVPQRAVTPGQAAVFYDEADETLLGGGWIR